MSTCPIPCLKYSPTPSHMPKPNASKTSFSKQKLFVLENTLPSFGKYIGLPFEANCWIIFPEQSWVSLRDVLLDHSPRKFFRKSSLEIPFTIIFHFSFLSCHALIPNFLGYPGAYEMHYAIFTIIHLNISSMHIYIYIYILTCNINIPWIIIIDTYNSPPCTTHVNTSYNIHLSYSHCMLFTQTNWPALTFLIEKCPPQEHGYNHDSMGFPYSPRTPEMEFRRRSYDLPKLEVTHD